MSWASDEWKDGLPPQVLQKISQLESQLTKFKKDRDQKQCQLESLEIALQNQKKKTEEEKVSCNQLSRDNKNLAETCEDLQKKTLKFQQDIQAKENQVIHLEGIIAHNKQVIDGENDKNGEYEQAQAQLNQQRAQMEQLEQETQRLMKENQELLTKLASKNDRNSETDLRSGDSILNSCSTSQKLTDPNTVNVAQIWGSLNWKEQLTPKAMQHMNLLEQQLEKLRKDRDQKQCQLDSLEQAFQNQKRKTEEARAETSSFQRELVSLSETCERLEHQRSKLQNELTARDNQTAYLTGQLNNTNATLEKELSKSHTGQQALQNELSGLKKAVTTLEQSKRELMDKNTALDQILQSHNFTIADLKQKLNNSNGEKEAAEKKLEEKMSEVQKLSEEISQLKGSGQQASELVEKLRATIMDKDLCLEVALTDADKLKMYMVEKEEQISTLTKAIETMKLEQIEVSKHQSHQKSLSEELGSKNKQLENELMEEQEKLVAACEERSTLQKELDKVRHCYTEQMTLFEHLKQSKQMLEEEKAAVDATCKHLEEDLSAAALIAQEKDNEHATALSNMQVVKGNIQHILDDLTKKFTALQQEHSTTELTLKEIQAERSLLISEKQHLKETLLATESQLSDAQEKCRLSQEEGKLHYEALGKAQAELLEQAEELNKKNLLLSQKDSTFADSRLSWERLEQELRSAAAEKENELVRTSRQLESMEAELSGLQASSNHLTQQNAFSQEMLAARESELVQLKLQVENLQKEALELNSELQETRNKLSTTTAGHSLQTEQLSAALAVKTQEASNAQASLECLKQDASSTQQSLSDKCDQLFTSLSQLKEEKEKRENLIEMLEHRCAGLSDELQASQQNAHLMQAKIDVLQMDLDDNESLVNSLNIQLSQEAQTVTNLKTQLMEKDSELKKSVTEVENIRLHLTESENKVSSLESEVQNMKVNTLQQESSLHSKISHLNSLASELTGAQKQLEVLGEQLSSKEQSILELQQNNDQLRSREGELLDNLESSRRSLQEKESTIQDMTSTCAKQADQLEQLTSSSQDNDKKIQTMNVMVEKLQADVVKERNCLKEEKEKLNLEIKNIVQVKEDLCAKLEEAEKREQRLIEEQANMAQHLSQQLNLVDKEKQMLSIDSNSLCSELKASEMRLTEMTQEIKDLKQKLELATQEQDTAKQRCSILSQELLESKESALQLAAKQDSLVTAMESLQQEYSEMKNNSTVLQQNVTSLEKLLSEKGNDLNDTKNTLEKKVDELSRVQHEMTTLTKTLSESKEKATNLEADLGLKAGRMEEEKQILKDEKDLLLSRLEDLQCDLNQKISEIAELQKKLDSTTQQHSTTDSHCQKLQTQLEESQRCVQELSFLVDQLSAEKETHINENTLLSTNLASNNKMIYSLEEGLKSKSSALEDKNQMLEELSEAKEAVGEKLENLKQNFSSREASFQELESELKNKIAWLQEERTALQAEKDSLAASYDELQLVLTEKDAKLNDVNCHLDTLLQDYNCSKQRFQEVSQCLEEKNMMVQELTSKMDSLCSEKSNVDESAEQLKNDKQAFLLKISSLEGQLEVKVTELEQVRAIVNVKQTLLDDLTLQIDILKETIADNSKHQIEQLHEKSKMVEKLEVHLSQQKACLEEKTEELCDTLLEKDALAVHLKDVSAKLQETRSCLRDTELKMESKEKEHKSREIELLQQLDNEKASLQKAMMTAEEQDNVHKKFCQDYENQIENLIKERNTLDLKMCELRQQIISQQAIISELEQKVGEESSLVEYLRKKEETENRYHLDTKKQLEDTISSLQVQLHDTKSCLSEKEKEFEEHLSLKNYDIENLRTELNTARVSAKDVIQQNEDTVRQTTLHMTEQTQKYLETVGELARKGELYRQEIQEKEQSYQLLRDQLKSQLEEKSQKILKLEQDWGEVRLENNTLQASCDGLHAKLDSLRSELHSRTQELEQLMVEFEQERLENKSQRDNMKSEKERTDLQLAERDKDIKRLSALIHSSENELSICKAKLEEAELSLKVKSSESEYSRFEEEAIVQKLESLQSDFDKALEKEEIQENRIRELGQQLCMLEADKNEAKSEVAHLTEELSTSQRIVQEQEAKLNKTALTLSSSELEIKAMKCQKEEVEGQMKSLQAELDSLQQDHQQLLESSQQDKGMHLDEIGTLKTTITHLTSDIQCKDMELNDLKSKLNSSDDLCSSLQNSIDELQQQIEVKNGNLFDLKMQLECLNTNMSDLKTDKDRNSTKLAEAEDEINQQKDQLRMLQEELDNKLENIKSSAATILELHKKIEASSAQEILLKAELEKANDDLKQVLMEKEIALSDLQEVKQNVKSRSVENKQLKEQLAMLETKLHQKDEEIADSFRHSLEQEQSVADTLKKELTELKVTMVSYSDKLTEKEQELKSAHTLDVELKKQLEEATARNRALSSDYKILSEVQNQEKAKAEDFQKTVSDLEHKKIEVEEKLEEAERKIAAKENAIVDLHRDLETLHHNFSDLNDSLNKVQSERDLLYHKLVSADKHAEDLHSELRESCSARSKDDEAFIAEKRKLAQNLEKCQEKLKTTEEELHEHKSQLQQLQNQLEQKQKEVDDVVSELQEAKSKVKDACLEKLSLKDQVDKMQKEQAELKSEVSRLNSEFESKSRELDFVMLNKMEDNFDLKTALADKQSLTLKLQEKEMMLVRMEEKLEDTEEQLKTSQQNSACLLVDVQQSIQGKSQAYLELEKRITELEEQKEAADLDKKNLETQISELSQQKILLEENLNEAEQQLEVLKQTTEMLPGVLKKEEERNCKLKSAVLKKENELLEVRKQLQHIQNEMQSEQNMQTQLKQRLENALEDVQKEQDAVSYYKFSLQSAESEITALRKVNVGLESDNSSLKQEVQEMKKQVNHLQSEIQTLTHSCSILQGDHHQLSLQLQEEKISLQAELDAIKSELCEKEKQLADSDDKEKQLLKENRHLQSQLLSIEEPLSSLKDSQESAQDIIKVTEAKLKEAEEKLEVVSKDLVCAQKARERLQQQVSLLEEQQSATEAARSAMELEVKDVHAELSRLQQSLKTAEHSAQVAEYQYRAAESKLELHREAQKQLAAQKQEYDEKLLAKHTVNTDKLSSLQAEKQELLQLLNDAVNTADQIRLQHTEAESQVCCLRQQLEQNEREQQKLHQEVEHLQQEKAQLEETLKTVNEKNSRNMSESSTRQNSDKGYDELCNELAQSKEETTLYLQQYNALLARVHSYKKEKEAAESKLERYKYIMQMKKKKETTATDSSNITQHQATSHASLDLQNQRLECKASLDFNADTQLPPTSSDKKDSVMSQVLLEGKSPESQEFNKIKKESISKPHPACERSCPLILSSIEKQFSAQSYPSKAKHASPRFCKDKTQYSECASGSELLTSVQPTTLCRPVRLPAQKDKNTSVINSEDKTSGEESGRKPPQGMMTRKRFSLTKRKSDEQELEPGLSAIKIRKIAEPDPISELPEAVTGISTRKSRLQAPSTRSALPRRRDIATVHLLDKININPATSSFKLPPSSTSVTASTRSQNTKTLSTITNSPKKSGVPVVKGLKKIPALHKASFSPDLSALKASGLRSSTTYRDRLKQPKENVSECKQS